MLGVDGREVLDIPIIVSSLQVGWKMQELLCRVVVGDVEYQEGVVFPMVDILACLVAAKKENVATLEYYFLPPIVVLIVDEKVGII